MPESTPPRLILPATLKDARFVGDSAELVLTVSSPTPDEQLQLVMLRGKVWGLHLIAGRFSLEWDRPDDEQDHF